MAYGITSVPCKWSIYFDAVLYNGTAITVLSKYDEIKVLELIESEKINMMSLVPTILTQLEPKITHHTLRVILLGGEFIPMALIDACEKEIAANLQDLWHDGDI